MGRSIPAAVVETELRTVLDGPLGWFRCKVILLCALVAVVDGFDVQAMAFVAPVLTQEWGIDRATMGMILMAGIAGLMLGTMLLGPLSDRWGRRRVIVGSTFAFAMLSLATATSSSTTELMVWRFLTGLGLGGALISGLSIASEYAPARARTTLTMVMFVGFPLGGSVGGLLSVPLTEHFGWQGVFIAGGIMPLLLGVVLWLRLPESPSFLIASGAPRERVAALIAHIAPERSQRPEESFVLSETASATRASIGELFREGRSVGTLLLWLIFFLNMIVMYLLITWLPTIFQQSGLPLSQAIYVAVTFNVGGIVGSLVIGRAVDRFGAGRALTIAYMLAAIVIWATGQATAVQSILVLTALAGAGVIGAQFCMYSVAASYYPTAIRSTGAGWAIGVGRSGALLGPLLGAAALAAGFSTNTIFSLSVIPSAICTVLMLFLTVRIDKTSSRAASIAEQKGEQAA